MKEKIKLLIVEDDSDLRDSLLELLEEDFTITTATNGAEGLVAFSKAKPEIVLTDIKMPIMDGLEMLSKIKAISSSTPVIIMTGHGDKALAIQALKEGAFDFLEKPLRANEIYRAIDKASAQNMLTKADAHLSLEYQKIVGSLPSGELDGKIELIAIGCSMGGPEALVELLPRLPNRLPPIVIAQHMLEGFTPQFVERLNRLSPVMVVEAKNEHALQSNHIYIAPAGLQTKVVKETGVLKTLLTNDKTSQPHAPCIDYLFHSAAKLGERALGVILTGMGSDGAAGLFEMKKAGAYTIAQDEKTSIVFGMPRVAIEHGAACVVLPLHEIPKEIASVVFQKKVHSAAPKQ